jgi:hypothetical protein
MTTTFHLDAPSGHAGRDTAKPSTLTATQLKAPLVLNGFDHRLAASV